MVALGSIGPAPSSRVEDAPSTSVPEPAYREDPFDHERAALQRRITFLESQLKSHDAEVDMLRETMDKMALDHRERLLRGAFLRVTMKIVLALVYLAWFAAGVLLTTYTAFLLRQGNAVYSLPVFISAVGAVMIFGTLVATLRKELKE